MFDKAPVDSDEEKQFGVKTSLYLAAGFAAAQFIEVIYWQVQLKQTFSVSFQQSSLHWFAIAAFFLVWAVVRQYVTTPQTRFFYLFFFWSGLSFLAKGLLSIVLPGGIALFYILLTGDWDLLRRMRLVYISDKIKTRTSVIIGTISSLLAVWLISYPMFKGRGLTGVFKDLLAFRIKTGSSQMYPFAWLKGVFVSLDKSVIYPLTKAPLATQLWIFLAVFAGVGILIAAIGRDNWKENLKAYLFPGMLIYLIVAGSWCCVMNFKHGLPFMREWFIYHHFSRLAGTIEKPNNSFDLYIKQIGFGMFPWSVLIPIALVRFLRWSWKDFTTLTRRRHFFFFCWFFFPYVFYTYSSTKFHHYIFPVVPPLAIIIAYWLSRLFKEDGVLKERIGVGASLMLFALLAKDLATNYKPLHQLFTYYTTRVTPGEVYPKTTFTFLFVLIFLVWVSIMMVRRVRFLQFGALMIPIAMFVLFVNVRLIPAVGVNFSYKSLYTAYKAFDKGRNLPFGEYSNWDERSTSYYFKNKSRYLGRTRTAKNFLRRKGPVFIMVSKRKIPTLRRLAKAVGKRIYILDRPHYDMWLVSTKLMVSKKRSAGDKIRLKKLPNMATKNWKKVNVDFGGKVRMVGVWIDKPNGYKRGDKVKIRFLFKVLKRMKKNWRIFIHADPVKWTRHRQNWDHEAAEGLYPTSEWKPGEYVQDIVVRTLPRNFPSHYSRLHVYMGFWLGSDRLAVGRSSVYHDGQNRVRSIVLKIKP
ncbi:MAG TPA: hypothetical protein DCE42_07235 [Myxococcales bacterium]|nr:hypothetical protein [Myxococcales bacterium]